MLFRRPSTPPESSNLFPIDSVVIVVPKIVLDRLFTLVLTLLLGGGMPVTFYVLQSSLPVNSGQSVQKR
jgi:hypothetical protein